jgi:hypothetical protein
MSDPPSDDDPADLPPGFHKWPRQHRIHFYAVALDRADIMAHIRSFIGSGTDAGPRPGSADRLSKAELSHIAADLGALPREESRKHSED